jgi:hypothetical protein
MIPIPCWKAIARTLDAAQERLEADAVVQAVERLGATAPRLGACLELARLGAVATIEGVLGWIEDEYLLAAWLAKQPHDDGPSRPFEDVVRDLKARRITTTTMGASPS